MFTEDIITDEFLKLKYERILDLGVRINTLYDEVIKYSKEKINLNSCKSVSITVKLIDLYYQHRMAVVRFILIHNIENEIVIDLIHSDPKNKIIYDKSLSLYEKVFLDMQMRVESTYKQLKEKSEV